MKMLGAHRSGHTSQARGRQVGPTGRASPGPGQSRPGGLDPGCARPKHAVGAWCARTPRARRDAAAPADGSVRRRGEAGPEWGREGAHGVEGTAVRLTNELDGGERRQRGGATSRGGGGRRRAATALCGEGGGRVRGGIERGKGGDANKKRKS